MYTTVAKVRELSGFDDSTLISDSIVKGKIASAEGMFDSAISSVYSLPLKYHRQNTITFAGTGSGSGTMSIVVNGVTYNIAITLGLTASQSADLFRESASTSAHFKVIDSVGDGAGVTIVSLTDSATLTTANAEVNITSAVTTEGISATIGTRSDRYAPIVDQIVAEIASALLLFDNYGIEAQDTPKDGKGKMEMINETLQKLQRVHKSGQIIKLFDELDKTELSSTSSYSVNFLPNNTTNEDSSNPTNYKMSINDEY